MNQSGNEMKWWEVPPVILEGSISNMPLSKRTPAQCFHFNSTQSLQAILILFISWAK